MQEVIIRGSGFQQDRSWQHRTKRIAFLGTLPPLRGLSSYCLELALAMAETESVDFISFKKLYPTVLYPGGDLKEDPTFPSVCHPNLSVDRRLTWSNPLSWFAAGFSTRADLLHAQWWSVPLFPIYFVVCGIFRLRRKPVVITVHNTRPHEKSSFFHPFSRLLFKLAQHFIVHTASNKNQLTDEFGIHADRVSFIPHGALDFHVRKKIDRDLIRREMGFKPDNKIILLFGSIRPYKGIDTALKAFAEVLIKVPESRLLIAGKLWETWKPYGDLIKKLNIEGAVSTRLEYIPSGEVYRYFSAADLVLLPYRHFDSQSGAGATAISFRKPLIVTGVGGLPDLVSDRRFVVSPQDSSALSEVIVECLSTPGRLKSMAAEAEIVSRKFTWTDIAGKTRVVYRKVLGEPIDMNEASRPWVT